MVSSSWNALGDVETSSSDSMHCRPRSFHEGRHGGPQVTWTAQPASRRQLCPEAISGCSFWSDPATYFRLIPRSSVWTRSSHSSIKSQDKVQTEAGPRVLPPTLRSRGRAGLFQSPQGPEMRPLKKLS